MNASKRPAGAAPSAPSATAAPAAMFDLNGAGDLQRQQLRAATGAACAMFRGFEAMRRVQEQAAHEALRRHAEALQRLEQPCGRDELLDIQAQLLQFDLEGAVQYWQRLFGVALDMQAQLAEGSARRAQARPSPAPARARA